MNGAAGRRTRSRMMRTRSLQPVGGTRWSRLLAPKPRRSQPAVWSIIQPRYSLGTGADMANPPQTAAGIVAHHEAALPGLGDRDGAPPHLAVGGDQAGHEVDVLAGRDAILDRYPDHLVAGAARAVPRAVLGREALHAVFGGKLGRGIEHDAQRG